MAALPPSPGVVKPAPARAANGNYSRIDIERHLFRVLLFILSAGLSLLFGLMRVINLAHGSFYLVGAYVGLSVIHQVGNFLLAALSPRALCWS